MRRLPVPRRPRPVDPRVSAPAEPLPDASAPDEPLWSAPPEPCHRRPPSRCPVASAPDDALVVRPAESCADPCESEALESLASALTSVPVEPAESLASGRTTPFQSEAGRAVGRRGGARRAGAARPVRAMRRCALLPPPAGRVLAASVVLPPPTTRRQTGRRERRGRWPRSSGDAPRREFVAPNRLSASIGSDTVRDCFSGTHEPPQRRTPTAPTCRNRAPDCGSRRTPRRADELRTATQPVRAAGGGLQALGSLSSC
jgi:hypothetical protein